MARTVSTKDFSGEEVTLRLKKIKDINETSEYNDKIKLPYQLNFYAVEVKSPIEVSTMGRVTANEFVSLFYINNSGYMQFSRYSELIAFVKILEEDGDDDVLDNLKLEDFDIDVLEGKEIKAIVKYNDKDDEYWIDWISTFKLNNIELPSRDEVESRQNSKSSKSKSDNKTSAKKSSGDSLDDI